MDLVLVINYVLCTEQANTALSTQNVKYLIAINSSVKNTINKMNPMTWLRQNFNQPFTSLKLKNSTTHEIQKIIHSLKCKTSHGYDGISTRILKISAPYILSPLKYIFNKVLSTGIYPERLKFSEVNPILKREIRQKFLTIDRFLC
jgi:hypothetical protein